MKKLLPLILLLSGLFFMNVSAQQTPAQVKANVASLIAQAKADSDNSEEEEAAILAIISQQIALFPQFAGEIVTAAINASDASNAFVGRIVTTALEAAPQTVGAAVSIEMAAITAAPGALAEINAALIAYGRTPSGFNPLLIPGDIGGDNFSSPGGLISSQNRQNDGAPNNDGNGNGAGGAGGGPPVVTNPNP